MKCPLCKIEMTELPRSDFEYQCSNVSCGMYLVCSGPQDLSRIQAAIVAARAEGFAEAIEQAAKVVLGYPLPDSYYSSNFNRDCGIAAEIRALLPAQVKP